MEGFFYFCLRSDEVTLTDLTYRRYGTIPAMSAGRFIQLAEYAAEEERKEEAKRAWLMLLPLMQMNMIKYMGFNEYYSHYTGADIDKRPDDVILAEVLEIQKQLEET